MSVVVAWAALEVRGLIPIATVSGIVADCSLFYLRFFRCVVEL
jgi:hypothetical protein